MSSITNNKLGVTSYLDTVRGFSGCFTTHRSNNYSASNWGDINSYRW
jgi:hypothetical protein